jgi:hypothetical protein
VRPQLWQAAELFVFKPVRWFLRQSRILRLALRGISRFGPGLTLRHSEFGHVLRFVAEVWQIWCGGHALMLPNSLSGANFLKTL